MRLVEPNGNDILIACPDGEWFLAMDIVVALIHRPGVNDLAGRGYYFECSEQEAAELDALARAPADLPGDREREFRGIPVKVRA